MSWVKLESRFPRHPKVVAVCVDSRWLHVCALCYSGEYLTNGFVPAAAVRQLDPDVKHLKRRVDELVDVGLWEIVEGGYQIHDYLLYNPSAEEVREAEEAKVRAGQAGGRASVAARRLKYGTAKPTEARPEAGASEQREAPASEAAGSSPEARIRIRSGPVWQEQEGAPAGLRREEEDDAAVVVDPARCDVREIEAGRVPCENNGDGAARNHRRLRTGGSAKRGGRRPAARNGRSPVVARLIERFLTLGEEHRHTLTVGRFDGTDLADKVRQRGPELVELAMVAFFENPLRIQLDKADYRLRTFLDNFDRIVEVNHLSAKARGREEWPS